MSRRVSSYLSQVYRNAECAPYPLQDRRGGVSQPSKSTPFGSRPGTMGPALTRHAYIPAMYLVAAAGFRLDTQLSAPRRPVTLGSKTCGAGPPSRNHHIHITSRRSPVGNMSVEAAAGFRLDSQLSAPRRFWKICGAGPPSRNQHIRISIQV